MAFPNYVGLDYGDETVTSTTEARGITIGTKGLLPDGRVFRYSYAGEAITAGLMCQNSLAIANHDMDLVTAATAVGSSTIAVTLGGTAVTKDQYKGGTIYVNDNDGEGQSFRIGAHAAVDSSGTFTVPLEGRQTVKTALTASSLCGVKANPYNGTLIYNTTPDGIPTGFTPTDVASGAYFWQQTYGDAAVFAQGTMVLGQCVVPSTNTTGAVDPHVATGDDNMNVALVCSPISVTTDYQHVFIIMGS
tara:strand:- start:388 stop:1128 length:741 start_codon:yes stop_codon:yes gene_type:complete